MGWTRRTNRSVLYGLQCLRARRLVEAGVRFVEVTCPNLFGMNGTWDQHTDLKKGHETNAFVTDQAVAALIQDLKSRGLLRRNACDLGRRVRTYSRYR